MFSLEKLGKYRLQSTFKTVCHHPEGITNHTLTCVSEVKKPIRIKNKFAVRKKAMK